MVFPSRVGLQAADIWVVRECPGPENNHPRTDSIMVSMGRYSRHCAFSEGRWTLDGPDAYYVPDPDEDPNTIITKSLKTVLQPLARTYDQYPNITIEVNPHGRHVLRDYFLGQCPLCRNDYWNSEDSEDFWLHFQIEDIDWCPADQACPVCMGYDFALEDVGYLTRLADLRDTIDKGKNPQNLSEKDFEACKRKFLSLVRERYTQQNNRKFEMGLELWDINDRVVRFQKLYIEGRESVFSDEE
ncbi:uncharacterized protein N7469_010148 [Penicillium citrinum]|uniref:Uncharacterized protein n=1 Tax=Penicillium citrinum TaxID=5077 RepID=A0A9W9NJY5_PENCI|nr:uncharacterized protein N7469_010148 [Penicillium citrinum]KAJ5221261.1 hypothetical protein N7469_010148 [Penicillium citrinum]